MWHVICVTHVTCDTWGRGGSWIFSKKICSLKWPPPWRKFILHTLYNRHCTPCTIHTAHNYRALVGLCLHWTLQANDLALFDTGHIFYIYFDKFCLFISYLIIFYDKPHFHEVVLHKFMPIPRTWMINRPGVARAVLQTALSFINWLIQ